MTAVDPSIYIHPTAVLLGNYSLGPNSSVWPNAVIRADFDRIDIGSYTSVQDCCVLHAAPDLPVIVGDYVTLGHGVVLHACTIEDLCVIGMNATVLDQAVIGRGSIVAAGAVVTAGTKVPPESMVTGVPGRIKPGRPGQVEWIREGVMTYCELAKKYLEGQESIDPKELLRALENLKLSKQE